jgi:tRNA-splicing ligase RtcB
MELMGRYAAASHELIHKRVARHLKAHVIGDVENHHNFAWQERHIVDGVEREMVVHRKGATPMAAGLLGVIPGTMADPGFVVRGKGNPDSLCSASHGAGRAMSRSEAKNRFSRKMLASLLAERGVTLMEAGVDECPLAYKDIRAVMASQTDLVEVLAVFNPKVVRMAPGGRGED